MSLEYEKGALLFNVLFKEKMSKLYTEEPHKMAGKGW